MDVSCRANHVFSPKRDFNKFCKYILQIDVIHAFACIDDSKTDMILTWVKYCYTICNVMICDIELIYRSNHFRQFEQNYEVYVLGYSKTPQIINNYIYIVSIKCLSKYLFFKNISQHLHSILKYMKLTPKYT